MTDLPEEIFLIVAEQGEYSSFLTWIAAGWFDRAQAGQRFAECAQLMDRQIDCQKARMRRAQDRSREAGRRFGAYYDQLGEAQRAEIEAIFPTPVGDIDRFDPLVPDRLRLVRMPVGRVGCYAVMNAHTCASSVEGDEAEVIADTETVSDGAFDAIRAPAGDGGNPETDA